MQNYHGTSKTDVKMDWCNTKIDGKQLDPKDQYPQMVNVSYFTKHVFYVSVFHFNLVQSPQLHWETHLLQLL